MVDIIRKESRMTSIEETDIMTFFQKLSTAT
jgi:hypothetical protein